MNIRKRLHDWARGPSAYLAAGAIGFLEASFLIIAVEPLLIPMLLARGRRAWLLALCPVLGNVAAGLLMYGLGAALAGPVIDPFVAAIGAEAEYAAALDRLRGNGFWALFIVGITPFPFQIGAAAAGVIGYPLGLFVLAVTLSRALRYLALALLVRLAGARLRAWTERYELEIFIGGAALFAVLTVLLFVL